MGPLQSLLASISIKAIEKGGDQPGDLGSGVHLQEMSARDEVRSLGVREQLLEALSERRGVGDLVLPLP